MKKFTILFSVYMLLLSYVCVSCEAEYIDLQAPTITISQLESEKTDQLSILFTPSEETANYRYAISPVMDPSAFTEGTMEGIETVEGHETTIVEFKDLTPGTYYYVYAQAFSAENLSGGLASCKVLFADKNQMTVVHQFNLSTASAFIIKYPTKYISCDYYLGTKADKEAFLNGSIEGIGHLGELMTKIVLTYPNIEAGKEYVFYAQATDILGAKSKLHEIAFTAPTKDNSPYAEMEVVHQDAFREVYKLTPNAECGKIVCLFNEEGEGAAPIVNGLGWDGDWLNLILAWDKVSNSKVEFMTYSAAGSPLTIKYDDYTFSNSSKKYMKAVLFDKMGQTAMGVMSWNFTKNSMPASAPKSHMKLEVSDITANGATYNYTTDENTLGFFFDTIDGEWWDTNKDKFLAKDKFYLHNLLKTGHKFIYGPDTKTYQFVEKSAKPGKKYYAIACPCNKKGPGIGWDDLVIVEYTTKAE